MPFVSSRKPILLTDDDFEYLNKIAKSRTSKKAISERAKIILLSNQGVSDSCIARQLGISRHVVMRTIKRVICIGIDRL